MTDQLPGPTPPWSNGVWIHSAHLPPRPEPAPDHPVRIGDAERDQALDKLGEHFAAGRLTREELDERTEQALAARFDRDLALLFRDLPASPRTEVVARPRPRGATVVPVAVALLVPLVVIALVASVVLHVPFLIGPVVWMVLLSGAGRRHHLR